MQTSDIFVIDDAYLPENPIKPNLKLNLAIASVLSFMLSVFIIFLLEFMDNTIKNENDLEKISDLPVLGIIPNLDEIDHHKNYGEEDQNGPDKEK
jgi:capsular polysaccharide biosynthesis protein